MFQMVVGDVVWPFGGGVFDVANGVECLLCGEKACRCYLVGSGPFYG